MFISFDIISKFNRSLEIKNSMENAIIYTLFLEIPMATAAGLLPGTFFWRPRLGAFGYGKGDGIKDVAQPITKNIRDELVVLIDGYSLGLTIVALTAGNYAARKPFLHLHPKHASYYNNAYRWGLRHVSLLAPWMGGMGSNYIDTHKVWRRRFYYMEEFVPKWMRKLTPWIEKEEWESEEKFMEIYNYYAEPAFGKHYRYPTKIYRSYQSQRTVETIENLDDWEFNRTPKPGYAGLIGG